MDGALWGEMRGGSMRKLLCVCMILAVMLGLSVAASAVDGGSVTVEAAGDTAPGGRISFIVSVSDSEAVTDCEVLPLFDIAVFELKSTRWLVAPGRESVNSVTGGAVAEWDTPTDIDGELYMFTLQVRTDVVPGTATVVSCDVSVTDRNGDPVQYQKVTKASVDIRCDHSTYVQKEDDQYIATAGDCRTPNTYYVSCAACGEKGTQVFQGSAPVGHRFEAKVESEQYLYQSGDCVNGASYYYSCTVCGQKGTETFVGAVTGEHVFNAKVETEEHLSDPGDCQNKREYYYSCAGCGANGTETFVSEKKFGVHVFDSSCDTDCNVCGKYQEPVHDLAEEWTADEEGHYHLCSQCGEKVDLQAHIPGPEATADEHQVCTVCGFVLAVSDEHVHEYSSDWSFDEKSHWHECSCGLSKSDLAVHSWSLVETDRKEVLIARCDVCGATKEEPVPDIPDETQPTYTDPTHPSQNKVVIQREEGVNVAAIVLGILLGLSLIGNGVLAYLLFVKKKK